VRRAIDLVSKPWIWSRDPTTLSLENRGFRVENKKRIETNNEGVQRARNEGPGDEKYERPRQASERINRWKDDEKAEAARKESKGSKARLSRQRPCRM
jgi:hypothetical protein